MGAAAILGRLVIPAEGLQHMAFDPLHAGVRKVKMGEADATQLKDEVLGNITLRMQLAGVPGLAQTGRQRKAAPIGELGKLNGHSWRVAVLRQPARNSLWIRTVPRAPHTLPCLD